MAVQATNFPDFTERQGAIRRWYEEKTMSILHASPGK
jgi:hypothetical protein